MTYDEVMAEFDALADLNYHTQAAIVLAKYLDKGFEDKPTTWKAYITILADIDCCHELQGYITPNQQAMRDLIQSELLRAAPMKKVITG